MPHFPLNVIKIAALKEECLIRLSGHLRNCYLSAPSTHFDRLLCDAGVKALAIQMALLPASWFSTRSANGLHKRETGKWEGKKLTLPVLFTVAAGVAWAPVLTLEGQWVPFSSLEPASSHPSPRSTIWKATPPPRYES